METNKGPSNYNTGEPESLLITIIIIIIIIIIYYYYYYFNFFTQLFIF